MIFLFFPVIPIGAHLFLCGVLLSGTTPMVTVVSSTMTSDESGEMESTVTEPESKVTAFGFCFLGWQEAMLHKATKHTLMKIMAFLIVLSFWGLKTHIYYNVYSGGMFNFSISGIINIGEQEDISC